MHIRIYPNNSLPILLTTKFQATGYLRRVCELENTEGLWARSERNKNLLFLCLSCDLDSFVLGIKPGGNKNVFYLSEPFKKSLVAEEENCCEIPYSDKDSPKDIMIRIFQTVIEHRRVEKENAEKRYSEDADVCGEHLENLSY